MKPGYITRWMGPDERGPRVPGQETDLLYAGGLWWGLTSRVASSWGVILAVDLWEILRSMRQEAGKPVGRLFLAKDALEILSYGRGEQIEGKDRFQGHIGNSLPRPWLG